MTYSINLKHALLAILAAGSISNSLAGFPSAAPQPTNNAPETPRFVEGEILVRFNQDAPDHQLQDALNRAFGRVVKHVQTHAMAQSGHPGITQLAIGIPAAQALQALQNHPAVVSAEPNYLQTKLQSADPKEGWAIKDRFYGDAQNPLWGMYGDTSGAVPGSTTAPYNTFGSQADEAWFAKYTGLDGLFNPVPSPVRTDEVVVGVIDEGISWRHPDLAGVIANPAETGTYVAADGLTYDRATDGADNDGNGKVDDAHGWDFISEDKSVFDPVDGYPDIDAHGTHVAGTIGAKANNSYTEVVDGQTVVHENIGVAGVIQNVKIISGKFLGPDGGTTLDAIQAIDYFTDLRANRGVNIVALNNSWGGGPYSAELHAAIIRAAKANILFIAAAGNGDRFGRGINNDSTPSYPASYDTTQSAVSGSSVLEASASYDSVISVAAIQADGQKASFSNYGATSVDLAAPGHNIVSTYPWQVSVNAATWDVENCYMPYNGTSMAAPHVTGAAALYAAHYPQASTAAIKGSILTAARNKPTSSMAGKCVTGGRLNLLEIGVAPTEPPPAPTAPPATPTGLVANTGIKSKGSSSIYLAWNDVTTETGYELQRAKNDSFTSGLATIQKAADSVTHTDTGLKSGVTYHYRIRAKNNVGASNWSTVVSQAAP